MDDLKARLRELTETYGIGDEGADRIEALEAALTQSRAETAAAYERAAQVDIHYIDDDGEQRSHKLGFFVQNSIRALATPDQFAALGAVRAEAMREAASIADDYVAMRINQIEVEKSKTAINIDVPQVMRWQAGKVQSEAIRDAILAAIKGAKA